MWWLIIPAVSLTTALLLGRLLERAAAEQTRPATGSVTLDDSRNLVRGDYVSTGFE
jgi:hypothetical protein